MTIDELLEKNVSTPLFTCAVHKPKAGSLHLLDKGDNAYIYVEGSTPYFPESDHIDSNCFDTIAELEYYTIRTEDIKILRYFLRMAERRIDSGKLNLDSEDLYDLCYGIGFPIENPLVSKDKGLTIGMHTKLFNEELLKIATCYALWKTLMFRDNDLLKLIRPDFAASNKKQLQSDLELLLDAKTEIRIMYKADQPQLFYHVENLMELMKAQLAVLVSMGENYLDGKRIARCIYCGNQFIQEHKSRKSCEKCHAGAARTKRSRNNAKRKEF